MQVTNLLILLNRIWVGIEYVHLYTVELHYARKTHILSQILMQLDWLCQDVKKGKPRE
jgi:hypothetical protein